MPTARASSSKQTKPTIKCKEGLYFCIVPGNKCKKSSKLWLMQLQWGLARALISSADGGGRPEADREALSLLDRVLAEEPGNVSAWRLAAIAHGRLGEQGLAALALAEVALGRGQLEEARLQSQRALKSGQLNAAGKLRAEDLAQEAGRRIERRGQ